ncbi:MAG: hypothetical protein ACRDSZ_16810 [Pseudonocardiaceae bacterium]
MSLAHDTIAIGMTGAFGSGCTTACLALERHQGFHIVRLSKFVREELALTKPQVKEPSRLQLQAEGDRIRGRDGSGVLAVRALTDLDAAEEIYPRVVFDGLRNPGEVQALQDRFGSRFALLGVLSDGPTRWDRVYETYLKEGTEQAGFLEDDERDRGEAADYGQQVARCVDKADAILVNSAAITLSQYEDKVLAMCDLLMRKKSRDPTIDEIRMEIAFASSYQSRCLKRHVGAVVIDSRGQQRSTGFNENPLPTKPCQDEPKYNYKCYRDIVRNDRFADLVRKEVKCPVCGKSLQVDNGPPWLCSVCLRTGVTTDLEPIFFPDRAMSWCTAIHAEDQALRMAGEGARGATLYTTTFPCFQCSGHIIMVGVREVVFVEAYPDPHSARLLDQAGVTVRQFEGVLSPAFARIFSNARPS